MIYITFTLNPLPCKSVRDRIYPADILFKILVVDCPTFGFLALALTAIPINGAVALTAGFRNFFQAVCVLLNFFVVYFLSNHLQVEIV